MPVGKLPSCQALPGAADVPDIVTSVGKVAIDALLGVTVADAAAIAAEADMVVELPFSGVPGNITLTYKSLPLFNYNAECLG
jgi:hypothetical protein